MAFGGSSDDDDRYNYTQDKISQGPTCFDKVKMGAQMGGAIGLCAGLFFGGYAIMRCRFSFILILIFFVVLAH